MTEGRDFKTHNETRLVETRTKIIAYQNQISWIACEYRKMKISEVTDSGVCIVLYENLNNIMKNVRDEDLDRYFNNEYIRCINGILESLKEETARKTLLSETCLL